MSAGRLIVCSLQALRDGEGKLEMWRRLVGGRRDRRGRLPVAVVFVETDGKRRGREEEKEEKAEEEKAGEEERSRCRDEEKGKSRQNGGNRTTTEQDCEAIDHWHRPWLFPSSRRLPRFVMIPSTGG